MAYIDGPVCAFGQIVLIWNDTTCENTKKRLDTNMGFPPFVQISLLFLLLLLLIKLLLIYLLLTQ